MYRGGSIVQHSSHPLPVSKRENKKGIVYLMYQNTFFIFFIFFFVIIFVHYVAAFMVNYFKRAIFLL
jgi:hypothetical protein